MKALSEGSAAHILQPARVAAHRSVGQASTVMLHSVKRASIDSALIADAADGGQYQVFRHDPGCADAEIQRAQRERRLGGLFGDVVAAGHRPAAHFVGHALPLDQRLDAALHHTCLFIRENEETFGSWHPRQGGKLETVEVRGPLASNDGECVLGWALDGRGVLMRSIWESAPMLRPSRLRLVLPAWSLAPADIYAVFPSRSHLSAKTRALVDALLLAFEPYRHGEGGDW